MPATTTFGGSIDFNLGAPIPPLKLLRRISKAPFDKLDKKSMLLLLLALTILLSGCVFLGEITKPPQPTPDWQLTRKALIEQREVLKDRASARQARLQSIQNDAPEQPPEPSGTTVANAPELTPSQIFAKLNRGEISAEAARVLLAETSSIVARQSNPTSMPMPTKISRWYQIQRDYKDERITYTQAVEQAIDAGMSRPHARIALAQIRIPTAKPKRIGR